MSTKELREKNAICCFDLAGVPWTSCALSHHSQVALATFFAPRNVCKDLLWILLPVEGGSLLFWTEDEEELANRSGCALDVISVLGGSSNLAPIMASVIMIHFYLIVLQ